MINEYDIAALRQQGDLQAYLTRQREQAEAECAQRRALVLRHPDIAARLTQPPLNFAAPERWTGYIPPAATATGSPNTSPIRPALLALVQEAQARPSRSVA